MSNAFLLSKNNFELFEYSSSEEKEEAKKGNKQIKTTVQINRRLETEWWRRGQEKPSEEWKN